MPSCWFWRSFLYTLLQKRFGDNVVKTVFWRKVVKYTLSAELRLTDAFTESDVALWLPVVHHIKHRLPSSSAVAEQQRMSLRRLDAPPSKMDLTWLALCLRQIHAMRGTARGRVGVGRCGWPGNYGQRWQLKWSIVPKWVIHGNRWTRRWWCAMKVDEQMRLWRDDWDGTIAAYMRGCYYCTSVTCNSRAPLWFVVYVSSLLTTVTQSKLSSDF